VYYFYEICLEEAR